MSAIATFDGIPIHKINEIETSIKEMADVQRTPIGLERRDVAGPPKRVWRVTTSPLHITLITPLEDHLWEIWWGYGEWWCWDLPKNTTVEARIDAGSWKKSTIRGLYDHRILSFTVIER
ncbi:MAG TPA: hypothetical protein PKI05_09160 [Thermogutta sp.]|nr:hypothetical protein [Thermogutta sp.]